MIDQIGQPLTQIGPLTAIYAGQMPEGTETFTNVIQGRIHRSGEEMIKQLKHNIGLSRLMTNSAIRGALLPCILPHPTIDTLSQIFHRLADLEADEFCVLALRT